MAQQRKASKHRRVALPDPVHKQMLVVCKGKHLGLKVRQLRSGVVIIKAFHDSASGEMGPVEAHGDCEIGDALLSVSEDSIEFLTYKALLAKIKKAPRPMTLRFAKWDGPEDGEEDPEEPEETAPKPPIKIYTSKDVIKAPVVLTKRNKQKLYVVIIGVLMVISWYLGARQTSNYAEGRRRESLQSMLNKFVRIRGHDGDNNVTVKVIEHDEKDGMLTLDLSGISNVASKSKGVRKRRHHKQEQKVKAANDREKSMLRKTTAAPKEQPKAPQSNKSTSTPAALLLPVPPIPLPIQAAAAAPSDQNATAVAGNSSTRRRA